MTKQTQMTPQQQKDELKKSWYDDGQIVDLLGYYLENLKGVSTPNSATGTNGLNKVVENIKETDTIVPVVFLTGKHPDLHFSGGVIVKDTTKPGPTQIAFISQNSDGPVPNEIRERLLPALEKKYGVGSVTHFDLNVKNQGNNIDCGPLTVASLIDLVGASLQCHKKGESIISKGADYFKGKLSIQKPENLIKLREGHAEILENMGENAGNIRIKPGSLAAKEELQAGEIPFEPKRKKPLHEEAEFAEFYQEKPKEKPQKMTIPRMAGAIVNAFFDGIVYGLGLEKRPETKKPEEKKSPKPNTANEKKEADEKEPKPISVTLSPEDQQEAKNLGNKVSNPAPKAPIDGQQPPLPQSTKSTTRG